VILDTNAVSALLVGDPGLGDVLKAESRQRRLTKAAELGDGAEARRGSGEGQRWRAEVVALSSVQGQPAAKGVFGDAQLAVEARRRPGRLSQKRPWSR
jgi:hypothetical protein